MKENRRRSGRGGSVRAALVVAGALAVWAAGAPVQGQDPGSYARESAGTRALTLPSGTTIRMLLDETNLGSDEVEVAEIDFPAGMAPSRSHGHGAIEIFYVVEGVLGHSLNGEEHRIEPGMVGVVKPGDEVVHRVIGAGAVKALVIWVPGGEGDRVAPRDRWRVIRR